MIDIFKVDKDVYAPHDKKIRKLYFDVIRHFPKCTSSWYGKHTSHSCGYCKPRKHENDNAHNDSQKDVDSDEMQDEMQDEMNGKIEVNDANNEGEYEEKPYNPHSVVYSQTLKKCPPHIYDFLMNKSWRRSGDYVYYPVPEESCCPQYAIRLKVNDFQLEKRHRVCKKKIAKYLHSLEESSSHENVDKDSSNAQEYGYEKYDPSIQEAENLVEGLEIQSTLNVKIAEFMQNVLSDLISHSEQFQRLVTEMKIGDFKDFVQSCLTVSKLNKNELSSNIAMKFFGCSKKFSINLGSAQKIAELIASELRKRLQGVEDQNFAHTLYSIHAKKGWINFDMKNITFEVPHKKHPRKQPHKEKSFLEGLDIDNYLNTQIKTSLTLATFDEEEYELYKRYQVKVHQDKESRITRKQYTAFLIDSNITPITNSKLPFGGYGTYHYQYRTRITNQLLGVSVVDILPTGWSSVYFFYDPDIKNISLGMYSILHEIELIKKTNYLFSDFKYLYLGLYTHYCKKMLYKASYYPSELLCPDTHTWVPLEVGTKAIESGKLDRFQQDMEIPSAKKLDDDVLDRVILQYHEYTLVASDFISILDEASRSELSAELSMFGRLVGVCSSEIIMKIS